MKAWKFIGNLKNGEGVYLHTDGAINVEKEFRYLINATPEEKQEIYKTWPKLIERAMQR